MCFVSLYYFNLRDLLSKKNQRICFAGTITATIIYMSKLFTSRRKSSKNSSKQLNELTSKKTNLKTKIINRTSHWNFNKITKYFLALGVIFALVTSYFWYSQLYMTPERRFWLAINNSMATPSVVRTLTEGGSGNQVVQDYRFNFSPQRVVQNRVVYTEKSATTDTSVTTEGIVYPTEQFLRYTDFTNSRTDNVETTNIDAVLGQWAIQEADDTEQAQLNYLSEQVSLVIFGNYGSAVRNELISEMKDNSVYGDKLSVFIEDNIYGEPVNLYSIDVKLRVYAEILNKAFVRAGYGEFPPLNPENYREDSVVSGAVYVSKKNNSIIGVSFGGREERYSNYGVLTSVERPEATITVEELQLEVQQLLQASQ
jgi:hypothetical protein